MRLHTVLFLLVSLLLAQPTAAQPAPTASLAGEVTDAATGQKLAFASVYLNGTTRGVTTNERGYFRLEGIALGTVELVASYTGYAPMRRTVRVDKAGELAVNLTLSATTLTLNETVVTARRDETWLRQTRQVEQALLGQSGFANQCRLVNPETLTFSTAGTLLTAVAREPLVIENGALGYRIVYTLAGFRLDGDKVYYGGTSLFSELTPGNARQSRQWQRNRQVAYRGSLRHLLSSLVANTHEREGFLVYQTDPNRPLQSSPPPLLADDVGRRLKPLLTREAITPGGLPGERWLSSQRLLEVFYTPQQSRLSPYRDAPYAYSQLRLPQGTMGITTTGLIVVPRGFEAAGYLGNDRLASALPDDWQPGAPDTPATMAQVPEPATSTSDVSRLEPVVRYLNQHPTATAPSVYLHVDKPLYMTGDRLWMSAYVLDPLTHRPDTAQRGPALSVELWSAAKRAVWQTWLPIAGGRGAGDFRLPDTLATGAYRLRAYTEGDRLLPRPAFERTIVVVNSQEPFPAVAGEPPTQPYPSSSPQPGTITLKVAPDDDSSRLAFVVQRSPVLMGTNLYLLVRSRGRLLQAVTVPTQPVATLRLVSTTWPTGLAQAIVLDSTGRLCASNVFYVPEKVSPVQTQLRAEAADGTGATVLTVSLRDGTGHPVRATVSVAITDANAVPTDSLSADCRTHLLLGDAYAWAEDPARLSYSPTPSQLRVLADRLRIAGWRRFLSAPATPAPATPDISLHGRAVYERGQPVADTDLLLMALSRGQSTAQTVRTDATGKFTVPGMILGDSTLVVTQRANVPATGDVVRVQFEPVHPRFEPTMAVFPLATWLNVWRNRITAARQRQASDPDYYRPNGSRLLNEVVVRAPKLVDNRPEDVRRRSLHDQVDATVLLDERTPVFDNLYQLIQAKVPGVSVQMTIDKGRTVYSVKFWRSTPQALNSQTAPKLSPNSGPAVPVERINIQSALFLIDGFPITDTDGTQLFAFNPADIERIEVLRTAATVGLYGVRASQGVIALYSKVWRDTKRATTINRQLVRGYGTANTFSETVRIPSETGSDNRDVLTWQPLLSTDEQGTTHVRAVVPRRVRAMRVVVQGITDNGQPVSAEQIIAVP